MGYDVKLFNKKLCFSLCSFVFILNTIFFFLNRYNFKERKKKKPNMTRKDLICYGKIITKIFCGFFFPFALPVVGNKRIFIVLWW